jgi:predicted phage terminase large subunit-like protein
MLVTYQNKLAQHWGRRIRQLLFSFGEEIFGISLDEWDRSSGSMSIKNHNGKILCVGAGGLLTGMGADAIIVDDPIKNQKEALSLRQRDNLWEWFKATLFTRLEPDGILLIVSTRWHEDDIIGRILANNPITSITSTNLDAIIQPTQQTNWHHLCIPAIAKDNDPLGRSPGEPLWKERFDLDTLNEQRKILGNFWFSALYQQEPIFSTGKIFKRQHFRYFWLEKDVIKYETIQNKLATKEILLLRHCSIFATIDLAIKTNERADYTVAIIFAISRSKEVFVLEVLREKFETTDHINLIINIHSRWQPVLIGVEAVQYQFTLVQHARRLGLPVRELKPEKDKLARSLAIANWIDAGKVFFRSDAPWLDEFEKELLAFPDGAHDDQVDALSYITQLIGPMTFAKITGISKMTTPAMLSLFEQSFGK